MSKSGKKLVCNIAASLYLSLMFFSCTSETVLSPSGGREDYGVFCGLDSRKIEITYHYNLVIIDGMNFSAQNITSLHNNGVRVYSYLNIGSIETFRDYYDQFKDHTLKDYAGWPEEKWMDVSYQPWQVYVTQTLAPMLKAKGLDGFFVDNSDVYSEEVSKTQPVYDGLLNIYRGLGTQGLPVIINGGDTFVERALEAGELDPCVKGINQECVFTSITSYNGDGVFGVQKADATGYYKAYLEKCKQSGKLQVYITEYMKEKSGSPMDKIADYCLKNNFFYYIAPSLKLDRDF
jgi:hypothetical protein